MNTIRAELTGMYRASAAGVVVTGHAPVLKLCRRLIEAGHDSALPLEAYRGAVLCLRIRSIGEGAKLTVNEATADGKPRFGPFRPFSRGVENVGGRAPMRYSGQEAAE